MSVAIYEAEEGNFAKAKEVFHEILRRPKLRASEAITLSISQIQVALIKDELEAAESAWTMLSQIADKSDPRVSLLRNKIDKHSTKRKGLGMLKSMFS